MQVQLSLNIVNFLMPTSNGMSIINLSSMPAPLQGNRMLIYIQEVQNKLNSRLIKQNTHHALLSDAPYHKNIPLLAQHPDSQFLGEKTASFLFGFYRDVIAIDILLHKLSFAGSHGLAPLRTTTKLW